MLDGQLLAFAGVSVVLSVTPGPALAVFFTTLLPQFISEGDPVFAKSLLLAALSVAIGMTWLVINVHLVDVVASSPRFRRAVEAVSGAVLIALGARLAIDRG